MREKLLTVVLAAAILLSVAMTIYVIATPTQGEKFTEFYLLGPEGMAYNYPTSLSVGENGTVILGVVNHEYERADYTLTTQRNNITLFEEEISLDHNESFQGEFIFTPTEEGDGKLEFLLYKRNVTEPYRSLHLWIKVRDAGGLEGIK
ncbi:MAG: DUF1616 domain-containing protein [Candidatus Altiarchaeales archaeon]|nr:DUF1616 domain-containing protein [Candidatus Altiarchaeales archaeon]